MKQQTKLRPPN